MQLYDKIFKPKKMVLENGKVVEEKFTRVPLILVLLAIGFYVSIIMTGFNFTQLVEKGDQFFIILGQMFPPETSYLPKIWNPLFDTIKMSLLGSFVGSVLAIPFAIIASSNIVKSKFVLSITRIFLSIIRTLPTLVYAIVATYIFGMGTMAGTFAIALFTFAYVGKQLYELIETANMGAYEAMESMGANRLKAYVVAISPQIMPSYISTCLFCLEGNVRYASILGYVGAGGLGIIMSEKIGWREYSSLGMIIVTLFATVLVIEVISNAIRKKLV